MRRDNLASLGFALLLVVGPDVDVSATAAECTVTSLQTRAPKGTTSGRLMIDRKGQAGR